jgi:uncharacterized membrane protein YtjA (UPF0391 family)
VMAFPACFPGRRRSDFPHARCPMLRWALIFLVVAIIAAIFGFTGIAGDAAWIARILLFVFLILFIISLVMGRRGSPVP